MKKVALLRGDYLNNFEMQNYNFSDEKIKITAFASRNPIHKNFSFETVFLPSLPENRGISFTANRFIGDRQILFGLEKYLTSFDIVHTADPHYYYSYQAARLRAEKKIKKLMVTSWETIPQNNETVAKKKHHKYFVMEHADKFLCYTERARTSLLKEGVNSSKIVVIPLGVDMKKFQISNLKLKINENSIKILFVGRLVEEKGILDLYAAFKEIRQNSKGTPYLLRIVGAGPLEKKLRSMIEADRLMDYISIEQKTYEEMPQVYQAADIFIMPSKTTPTWEEQYGMVLIEALASGLPIIAYDSGSIPELLNETGTLVKEGNINGIIQAVTSLTDSKVRQQAGQRSLRLALEKYDAAKAAQELQSVYLNL